jgi:hypothetical protein
MLEAFDIRKKAGCDVKKITAFWYAMFWLYSVVLHGRGRFNRRNVKKGNDYYKEGKLQTGC